MRVVGICGTPGTGKKTVAPLVGRLLDLPAISLNSFAPRGATEVDPVQLRRALLKKAPRNAVLFGHLLPHVVRKSEARLVAVLRCEPSVLGGRLRGRGYPGAKVIENVEAELIGVLLDECLRTFGGRLVREYDTTSSSPQAVADAIARDARAPGWARKRGGQGEVRSWIDWTLSYDSSSKLRALLSGAGEPPAST